MQSYVNFLILANLHNPNYFVNFVRLYGLRDIWFAIGVFYLIFILFRIKFVNLFKN